jgi:hypothetical protein
MESLEREKREAFRRLNTLTEDPDASDDDIKKAMIEIDNLNGRSLEMRNGYVKEVSDVLSVKQQGKLMVFEEMFKKRMREIIEDIRGDFRGRRMQGRNP